MKYGNEFLGKGQRNYRLYAIITTRSLYLTWAWIGTGSW